MKEFTKPQANKPQKPSKLSPFVLRAVTAMATSILQMRDDCHYKSSDYDFLDHMYIDFQCIVENNMKLFEDEED